MLAITQPLEVYYPTSKHNPIVTPVQMSPFLQLTAATPLSDAAVLVLDPVAVDVAVVLAPVSGVEGNPELVLVLVALSAPMLAPVVTEEAALLVSVAARELEATVSVDVAVALVAVVGFSMSTMDRTHLAASSVDL